LKNSNLIEEALDALEQRRPQDALKALSSIVRNSPSAPAHLLSGAIFEYGGPDVPIDLDRAISHYRCASHLIRNRDPRTLLYLARAHMKLGPARYAQALRYIREAGNVKHIPDVDLAFAKYYDVAESNVALATRYFARAAMRGSIAGALGLSRALRRSGFTGQAFAVDVMRVVATPLVLMLRGRESLRGFSID